MPKRIEYQELIDLDGYRRAVADARADYQTFTSDVQKLNGEVARSMQSVIGELKSMKSGASVETDNRALSEYEQRAKALSQQLKDQKAATEALNTVQAQHEKVVGSLVSQQEKLLNQYAAITGNTAKDAQQRKRLATELAGLATQLDKISKVNRIASDSAREVSGTYNKLSKELNEARKALKSLEDGFTINGKINTTNQSAVALSNKITLLDSAVKQADRSMGQWQRNVGAYPQTFSGAILGLSRLSAGFMTARAALSQASSFVDASKQAESFAAAMQAVHSSNEQAAESEKFVYEQADKLGSQVESTASAFTTLAGATRGSVLEGDQTRRIWNSLITAGVGMKRSNEEIQRAVVATGQVFSKQKVQAEELSGQLAEALPGSLQILAKEMGVSTSKMLEMAKDGDLLALDVLPKLADGLERTFSKTVADNASNLGSESNRLNNAVVAFKRTLFEETGAKSWFIGFLQDAIQDLKDLNYLIKNFSWGLLDKELGNSNQNMIRPMRLAAEKKASTYDSFKSLSTAEMEKVINLQEQSEMTAEQTKHVQQLRKIYQDRLAGEKKLADETSKQRFEQGAKQRDKDKKTRAREAEKDRKEQEREAEQRLRESIQGVKAKAGVELSGLETAKESGGLTNADYLNRRLVIQQDAVLKEQDLLRKARKENTAEYAATQKELNDIATEYIKARNKIEEDAFKSAVASIREVIQADTNGAKSLLIDRLKELETAYDDEVTTIKSQITRREISEEEGFRRLGDLRSQYLEDAARATAANSVTIIQLTEKRINELEKQLRAEGKSEADIIKALQDERERLDKQRLDAKQDAADKEVEINQQKNETLEKSDEASQRKRDEIVAKAAEVAIAAVSTYVEITNSLRDQDLARLEKRKDRELELLDRQKEQGIISAAQAAESKDNIERKYNSKSNAIKRQQAAAEKAAALFSIALNTAVNATKVGTNPVLLALVIALGALQAAAVLAKPAPTLPEYFKGTSDAPEGPAWVAERGYELVESKQSGKPTYRLMAEKQVAYLNKHDRVYTHEETKRILKVNTEIASEVRSAPGGSQYVPPVIVQQPFTEDQLGRAVAKGLASLTVQEHHYDEQGHRKYERKANQRTQWLNDYFSLPRK